MMLTDDPLWYKDSIIYQVHIKAYKDSDNDGVGDFRGLIEKLDYIKSLGVTVLWLLPFYPSPLKDDGYDIADYLNINPDYGTIEDFREFLKEAHRKKLKVITELVLNHTSDQHEWFQRARNSAPGSPERSFYVWSDTPEKYKDARIIFQDFEFSNWTWDHTVKAYYWHRFYSHQPDLNFENPAVQDALLKVLDFWFEMGVDGLRLDAVPYLYEREGTNCENLPETHAYLKKINTYIQSRYKNKMLLAEANQWPEDAVAYFGQGDECQMAFHFPLMPRIYMATQMEERFPIIDILEQTPPIPENCQWAMFLRNHDELTLEMVTDEERDYMYRFFARDSRAKINLGIRRRLAPLIENNRRKIELLNILLFSFPGTPIIYYGDEIGMGDNFYLGDRNGVRTPMQWSPDRNAGFSDTNPQKLFLPVIIDPEYHYETVNVEVQQKNPSSLFRWMQKAISIRKRYSAFGRGELEFLNPSNPKLLVFTRKFNDEIILIVANLSRFSQAAEIDLSKYNGYSPREAFSRNKFPIIKESPYILTLSAYDYYWFILESQDSVIEAKTRTLLKINLPESASEIFSEGYINILEDRALGEYISICRWYNGEKEKIQNIKLADVIRLPGNDNFLVIFRITYINEQKEIYILPLTFIAEKDSNFLSDNPLAVIAEATINGEDFYLIDGFYNIDFRNNLFKSIMSRLPLKGNNGKLNITGSSNLKFSEDIPNCRIASDSEQEVLIEYGEKYLIKFYRKIEEGIHPGVEISENMQNKSDFIYIIPYAGNVKYRNFDNEFFQLALISNYVITQGTAWQHFSDIIKKYFETSFTRSFEKRDIIFKNIFTDPQRREDVILCESVDKISSEMIKILGRTTADFHKQIASINTPAFVPEEFSMLYQRSLYQSIRTLIKATLRYTDKVVKQDASTNTSDLKLILQNESVLLAFLERILQKKIESNKIRIHGNFHLDNVLFTGKEFIISNYEGNPSTAFSERRIKRSALRDAASLIYSIHYIAFYTLRQEHEKSSENFKKMEYLANQWWLCISGNYIHSYIERMTDTYLIPSELSMQEFMLHLYMLEKAFYELRYALENNKNTDIPVDMIKYIIGYIKES